MVAQAAVGQYVVDPLVGIGHGVRDGDEFEMLADCGVGVAGDHVADDGDTGPDLGVVLADRTAREERLSGGGVSRPAAMRGRVDLPEPL